MLVDSGFDITMIPFQTGLSLGYTAGVSDLRLKGHGVSGSFTFISKEVNCIIDGRKFKLPIAWVQDPKNNHLILGREVVFDLFDIEFKQAEETIIFRWRRK